MRQKEPRLIEREETTMTQIVAQKREQQRQKKKLKSKMPQ